MTPSDPGAVAARSPCTPPSPHRPRPSCLGTGRSNAPACSLSFIIKLTCFLQPAAYKKQVNFYFPPTDFSAGLGFSLPLMGNLCSSLCSCLGQEEHEVAQSDPMMDAEARALAAEAAQRRLAAYEQSA